MCYHRQGGWANRWGGYGPRANKAGKWVPVNIQENETDFELSLYAPGLEKERIKVAVKDDVLTVSYLPSEEKKVFNFTRREYRNESFERSFVLNGKVQVERIQASYVEGILKIVLGKNPDANKPAQTISVA